MKTEQYTGEQLIADTPAAVWDEAYPLGNGTLGTMVFGGIEQDTITLNHDTLWSGFPNPQEFRANNAALERAKTLVREKKYTEAEDALRQGFVGYAVATYMPMGTLHVRYLGFSAVHANDYRRSLALAEAVNTVSYTHEGHRVKVRSFVSHPDRAFVYRAECESDLNLEIRIDSQLYSRSWAQDGKLYLEGECPFNSEQNILYTDRKGVYSDDPQKRGMRFLTVVGVRTDGTLSESGNLLRIRGAHFAELYLTCETSFNGTDKHPFLEGKDYKEPCKRALNAVLAKKYEDIFRAHVADFQQYYSRVRVDLGSSGKENLPTRRRLLLLDRGEEDCSLPILLYQFGRYLTIAASRPGSQAMNLQGIWSHQFFEPWHSDYTVNINTEMNYFPTLQSNLAEFCQPLTDLIEGLVQTGRITAKTLYNAPGWVCHHNTDLWRFTQGVAGEPLWSFWNGAGGWLCRHLYEYWEYTLDDAFLRDTAFPILCDCAAFYLSQLETLPNGQRAVFPSTSPENQYKIGEKTCCVSETCEMTAAIVRELFEIVQKVSARLQIQTEITRAVEKELPHLYSTQIGNDGRILEWYGERDESEVHHRHISHLYSLYPWNAITPQTTPELAKAAAETLRVRGDDGTGWSIAWKACCFARLHDGNHALNLIRKQLHLCGEEKGMMSGGGTLPNLFCAHPPFQIDGNFGAEAAVGEMLLYSDLDTVSLLPACPDSWKNVEVRGLRAKGAREISYTVQNGKLISCEIVGSKPKILLFKNQPVSEKDITLIVR